MNTLIEQALKKYPKAKQIAVENATFAQQDDMAFRMNLASDALMYRWNQDTINAIKFVMAGKTKLVAA